MKKKKTANLIMVAVIAVIAVGGVLTAGHIRGWFGGKAGSAVLKDISGIVTLERDGVSFSVHEDTELRKGDKISCAPAATVKISAGEGSIILGEEAGLKVEEPSEKSFRAFLSAGEAFAEAKDAPMEISFENGETLLKNAVGAFSVRTGAQSVSVYYGEVDGAKAGEVKEWVGSETYTHELDINSLNDFNIACIRMAGDSSGLYFAKADVDALEARRQAEIEQAKRQAEEAEARKKAEEVARIQAEKKAAEEAERKAAEAAARKAEQEAAAKAKAESEKKEAEEAARKAEEERKAAEEAAAQAKDEEEKKSAEEAARKAEEERLAAEEAARIAEEERLAAEEAARIAEEERLAAEEAARIAEEERLAAEAAAEQAAKLYCYLTIRCDTILDNWDDLDPEKAPYVPANGVILGKTKIEFQEGETVFDVLKRICTDKGIQIEYSYTPMFANYYIEGIHHIYEFDCGPESGWMYKVNGWFPNYGCSDYILQKEDSIVWCYTCKGLGSDVGGSVY